MSNEGEDQSDYERLRELEAEVARRKHLNDEAAAKLMTVEEARATCLTVIRVALREMDQTGAQKLEGLPNDVREAVTKAWEMQRKKIIGAVCLQAHQSLGIEIAPDEIE